MGKEKQKGAFKVTKGGRTPGTTVNTEEGSNDDDKVMKDLMQRPVEKGRKERKRGLRRSKTKSPQN